MTNADKIPASLREIPSWVCWQYVGADKRKLPKRTDGRNASSTDPTTWASFDACIQAAADRKMAGVGFVLHPEAGVVGIDLDGCRDVQTGTVAEWAKQIIQTLDTYTEVSPSGTGFKLFCCGKSPFATGKQITVDVPKVSDKTPQIEIYDRGRYFTTTGMRAAGVSPNVEQRQEQLDTCFAPYIAAMQAKAAPKATESTPIIERARAYVAKMPPAVAGQQGHAATFHVACVLCLGFSLHRDDAMTILREFNDRCQPAWSERDLTHKVDDALKQSGPRGYLSDVAPEHWHKVRLPKYSAPAPVDASDVKVTTLLDATEHVFRDTIAGNHVLIELGLPDVDYAIGGGVERGELLLIAARPSHGKSALALQICHHITLSGRPCLFVSEEMSAHAIGKRTLQFVSATSPDNWAGEQRNVERDIAQHFGKRSPCYLAESCGSVDRVVALIETYVDEHAVEVVAVDYVQMLGAKGAGRYEVVTNASRALRAAASRLGIVIIALCQLSRAIESRNAFIPFVSDLKESGQLEQDADVILLVVWPHRIDSSQPANKYQIFVGKNRNRAINTPVVELDFMPSRQMVIDPRDRGKFASENFSGDLPQFVSDRF